MTEDEWLTTEFAMLLMFSADRVQRNASNKSNAGDRLSVAARVACLQRLGADVPDGVRQWIALADEFMNEGKSKVAGLRIARPLEYRTKRSVFLAFRAAYESADLVLRQRLAAAQDVFHGGGSYWGLEEYLLDADDNSPTYGFVYKSESADHCDIIRDIFGNPFRPVAFAPEWRTDTALALAKQMYESREFSAMPILADALQDAGCNESAILDHCRDTSLTHVRGCWVTDLVLGKE